MTRNEALILLTEYTTYLLNNGFTDVDILGGSGEPSAIDDFTQTPFFKKMYPFVLETPKNKNKSLGRAL